MHCPTGLKDQIRRYIAMSRDLKACDLLRRCVTEIGRLENEVEATTPRNPNDAREQT